MLKYLNYLNDFFIKINCTGIVAMLEVAWFTTNCLLLSCIFKLQNPTVFELKCCNITILLSNVKLLGNGISSHVLNSL